MRKQVGALAAAALLLAMGGAACSRNGGSQKVDKAPVETQSATKASSAEPMTTTVTGCLRAGDASGTFVLTAARTAGAIETATYQLVGGDEAQLSQHMGQRVQVSGTTVPQEEIASRSPAETEQRAKGTSGTPTVQTQTDVQIRQLRVDSFAPQGDKCEGR